jgi:hypothetical protein
MTTRRKGKTRQTAPSRRGAILVSVLVTLMVASLLFGAMLRTGRQEHVMLRDQQLRLQALELRQSGIERAAAQLFADEAYAGEAWQIPAAELNGRNDAAVKIAVVADADRPRRRQISVEVSYPASGERRVQQRSEVVIDLPPKQNSKG